MSVRARACSRDGEERGDGGASGGGVGVGVTTNEAIGSPELHCRLLGL